MLRQILWDVLRRDERYPPVLPGEMAAEGLALLRETAVHQKDLAHKMLLSAHEGERTDLCLQFLPVTTGGDKDNGTPKPGRHIDQCLHRPPEQGCRADVLEGLEFLGVELDKEVNAVKRGEEAILSTPNSKVKVLLIPTDEELMIASDTYDIVKELK